MCLCWKVRQRRLGVDDFGKPLEDRSPSITPIPFNREDSAANASANAEPAPVPEEETNGERAPLLGRPKSQTRQTSFWRSLFRDS